MALFWGLTISVFLLDRVVKILSLSTLPFGQAVVVWQGVLEWRLTRNQGMALGLFSGNVLAITVLPVLAVVIGWLVFCRYRFTPYTRVATALVAGGFLGNLLDRLSMGSVLDMVYFPWMPWYICNLADIAICFGVALLAISLLLRPDDWRLKTEAKPHEPSETDRTA